MSLLHPPRPKDGVVEEVAGLSGQNIYACYQCGKCTAVCPFSFAPQQLTRFLQLGQVDRAMALDTLWECANCFTCTAACPKGVDPVRIIRALRTIYLRGAELPVPASQGEGRKFKPRGPYSRGLGKLLRAQLFANIHRLSHLGSALAPLSNWLLKLPGAPLATHHLLGIHKARSLPPFARPSFPAWFRRHTPLGDGHRGTVLFFHDTFVDYNLPQVGIAATELLEKAGFHVELADNVCCGRPMISKGFFSVAEAQARTNLARLYEHARKGVYIVGCEPSCLLALRDEYPDLVQDPTLKEQAAVVARQALLIDEFLAMLSARGEMELTFRPDQNGDRPVLFHGHCHQKALASPARSLELLHLAGYKAELINAACCGMAGAFGYEKEHYELSKAAGERGLFPAVRAQPEAELVVMGISCRQQIEHFTGRRPRHLVEVLRDSVA